MQFDISKERVLSPQIVLVQFRNKLGIKGQFCFALFFLFVLETGPHCATLAGLGTHRDAPASAFFVLELKVCITTDWLVCLFLVCLVFLR